MLSFPDDLLSVSTTPLSLVQALTEVQLRHMEEEEEEQKKKNRHHRTHQSHYAEKHSSAKSSNCENFVF